MQQQFTQTILLFKKQPLNLEENSCLKTLDFINNKFIGKTNYQYCFNFI